MKLRCAAAVLAAVLANVTGRGQEKRFMDLNTALMEATFRLEGKDAAGRIVFGTAFVMARPFTSDPTKGRYVLVTAAHVIEPIGGRQPL